jgi:SAM-dependent MidA family methyltransferase
MNIMTEADTISEPERLKALRQLITQEIKQHNGKIDFAHFMRLALYSKFGYYQAKPHILGEKGDFITAPELSELFSKCLADQCMQVLSAIPQADILEFGAGTGSMAKTLMLTLHEQACEPHKYYIIEPNTALHKIQKETLELLPLHLRDKFVWVTEVPENFTGVLLANEVLDALPVHRFKINNQAIFEYNVALDKSENFQWQLQEITNGKLYNKCSDIKNRYLPDITNYSSEYNMAMQPFLHQVMKKIKQGVFIIIDYGYHDAEYYHPERSQGTLTCFYQHRHHDNPLLNIGNQDISAHVNFSDLAKEALRLDFKILGYTHQAAFLLNCNLLNKIDEIDPIKLKQQIQTLTLPTEMGELIKVIALAKNFSENLLGFASYNKRHYLLENLSP